MAAKLARLTHKIAVKLHLVAESYTICSYRSRRPVRKLLYTLSYLLVMFFLKQNINYDYNTDSSRYSSNDALPTIYHTQSVS